jgi:cell division protein FtsQ
MLRLPSRLRSMRLPVPVASIRLPARVRALRVPRRLRAMSLRQRLVCLAVVPVLGVGGWLVLRDSSLFSVENVRVVGLTSDAAPAVSEDLLAAARSQTTTNFSVDALRAAVSRYTLIEDVRAQPQPPHGLRIEVVEREPIARLDVGRRRFLIDGDGMVITGALPGRLAVLRSSRLPSDGVVRDRSVLLALHVLAAAPAPLLHCVVTLTAAHGVLTIYLHRGPRLIFGNGVLPHAKWDASAAVLANPNSRGASYIDVQVPWRPAAQVGDGATMGAGGAPPAGAATVATLLNPSLVAPST